ncbi:UPF0182 family protein [Fodinisporobacter ferrooxydans]|uniref:UPF0182 protein LSG31_08025 n=1 Tax=Fodinisporobacter ferrooxydans TaxID=2901836 RepID=A0ABY4CNS6_9BACL|nr:UPF0182 family protein [Alicyclobacillaceae bacterium MYW30-H2]
MGIFRNKQQGRSGNWLRWMAGIVVVCIVLLTACIRLITEYEWQASVHYAEVYITRIAASIGIEVIGFLLYAVVLFGTFFIIRRNLIKSGNHVFGNPILSKMYWIVGALFTLFIAGIGGGSLSSIGWREALLFFDHVPFAASDPVFHKNIAFYVFELPVYEIVLHACMVLVFLAGIMAPAAYFIFAPLKKEILMDRKARRHVAAIWALFLILWGIGYYLNRYDLLYDDSGVVYGAGYTQIHVQLPYDVAAMVISIVGAALLYAGVLRGKLKWAATGPLALVALMIVGGIVQLWVQKVNVGGNEVAYETPYLKRNIEATRAAFGIDAKHVADQQMDPTGTITGKEIARNADTIKNIRINDVREVGEVLNQLQGLKPYYHFNDVDVDRYQGQEVYISARSLQPEKLPQRAQTWLNQTLVYTHGYGAVVSPVNQVTADGLPEFLAKDMPQAGTFGIRRPEIYFDESTAKPVIVDATLPEFNYPNGDTDITSRYSGKAGISLGGWNRLLFAWRQESLKLLTSPQISANSKILFHRNIYERLQEIAPFLQFDQDAYLVKRDNGHLVWIVDAYTTSSRYPYSEGTTFNGQTINYIRNSVKAVVDAYDGTVQLYRVDPNDPIAASYAKIFPNLFAKVIPDDIKAHFRYPEHLFSVQANTLLTYHVNDPQSFYNRDDVWSVANEVFNGKPIPIQPLYQMMKLPQQNQSEFVLTLPITPQHKDNLVAWMVARNDGDNYGRLELYEFPRGKLIYGPLQVESRIDQEPSVSQQLTLWNQQGSHVIRGNLLPIFIDKGLLYVEPIYIQADRAGALPQVKRVIVVYQDKIVMEDSIAAAFEKLFGTGQSSGNAVSQRDLGQGKPSPAGQSQTPGSGTDQKQLADQAYQILQQYQQATAKGDFEAAGKALKQLQDVLKQLKGTIQ